MKKITLFLLAQTLLFATGFSQQVLLSEIDSARMPLGGGAHYMPEYLLDVSMNPAAWAKEKSGLHVSFGSTDQLYFRTEVPSLEKQTLSWEATGWKGERLNAQILVWSPDTLEQVYVVTSDLKNEKGQVLSKKNLQVNKVCYVLSNYPYNAKGFDCGPTPYKNGYLMPDRFEAFNQFELPGKTIRPVWLGCEIPANTEAGTYNGTVEVRTATTKTVLNIKINVQKQELPKPHDWHHRLDLWQNPWVIASYYNVKPWGEEFKTLLKKHLKLYADAGGTFITTYGVHSPWAGNEYVLEEGMIEWIKQENGAWKFDYNIFDQYVELAMSVGIDKAITVYTPVPWGNKFRYMNEATGTYMEEILTPDSKTFVERWNTFLNDLKKHLDKKGWLNKTYIGINENPMDVTLAAIKATKNNWKGWKITYAGDWHPELDSLLDDYCFLYSKESNVDVVKARTAKGLTTTYYVCCNPDKPNNFLFSPPVEGRWISWYSAAHGYSGFLRWAYDAWPADPVRDARFGSWAAGDCYLIYPGGNSCIRYEKLREGIVDYEKIRILKEKAAKSSNPKVQQLLQQLNEHLEKFLKEKEFDTSKISNDVEQGKALLNQLSELL